MPQTSVAASLPIHSESIMKMFPPMKPVRTVTMNIVNCIAMLGAVVAAIDFGNPITASAAEPSGGKVEGRPNIVLFFVDDFGARDLSCYGSEFYQTPHMDALAANGVRFTNAYAGYSRCVSSRTALLSGKVPARVEYAAKKNRDSEHHLPLSEVTFGEALRDHGYATCYIGKWHLGKKGGGPGEQGFDTVIHSGSAGATGQYFYPFKVEKGNYVDNPVVGKEGDYLNDLLTDKAVEYIGQQQSDKPFLMVMAHYAVHTPFEAPEDLTKQYKKKLRKSGVAVGGGREDDDFVVDRQGMTKTVQNNPVYAAMVENTDASLGRIMDAISDAGIADNTIVILTSDHGGLSTRGLDNHRPVATSNAPYRQGKGSIFEGGMRVPLIVSWPGKAKAGVVSEVQVTGYDHFPTMLEMAGANPMPEQHVDGESYVRATAGESYQRSPMFWYKWMARPDSTGDTRAMSLVEGNYKIVKWIDEDLVELFDLQQDPGEQNNLAEADPERTAAMLAQVLAIEQEVGDLREAGKKMLDKRLERAAGKATKRKARKNGKKAKPAAVVE